MLAKLARRISEFCILWLAEKVLLSPTRCQRKRCDGEVARAFRVPIEPRCSAIDIDNEQTCGCDADVGIGSVRPPAINLVEIRGGFQTSARTQRYFTTWDAREDCVSEIGVAQGGLVRRRWQLDLLLKWCFIGGIGRDFDGLGHRAKLVSDNRVVRLTGDRSDFDSLGAGHATRLSTLR